MVSKGVGSALACALMLSLCLALAAGCGTNGSPPVDTSTARGAVLGWSQALEDGNTQELTGLAAQDYSYDGANLAPSADGSGQDNAGGMGMPAWMGGGGTTTVELLSLEETSPTTAIARVSVQYVGTLGYGGGGIDYGGSGGAPATGGGGSDGSSGDSGSSDNGQSTEGEQPGFSSPGFEAPKPPSVERPGNGAGAEARCAPRRTGLARQLWGGDQFSYTAILVLGMEKISDVWFIVSQRQESSITLMGDGATSPVIDEVTATPDTAVPGTPVIVAGSVRNATGEFVTARIGWQYAQLALSGGAFSGEVRTPRHEGTYVVEVEATNSSGGAWGSATRSVEIVLAGEPVPSYTLDVPTSVVPAVVTALRQFISGVRDPNWQDWQNTYADALAVVADDYAYNGEGEWGSIWACGIQSSESTDLTAALTQAGDNGGVYQVVVDTAQKSIGGWGYGYDIVAPMNGGGGSSDGATGGVTEPDAAPRQFYVYGDVTAHASVLFELESRGGEWLITAVRTLSGWSAPDDVTVPTLALVVNGGQALDVPGHAPIEVQGTLTGWQGGGYFNAGVGYESWAYDSISGDTFTAELTAPGQVGRWALVVNVDLAVDSTDYKMVSVYASEEVRVTEAAPDEPSGDGDEPLPPDVPGEDPASDTGSGGTR